MLKPSSVELVVVAILLAKHCLFDFVLQTKFQLSNKYRYAHPGGVLHGMLHALGTAATFVVATPAPVVAFLVLGGEFLAHYHIDWAKEQILRRTGWTHSDARYWRLFGADQLLHGWTYVVIAWVLPAGR